MLLIRGSLTITAGKTKLPFLFIVLNRPFYSLSLIATFVDSIFLCRCRVGMEIVFLLIALSNRNFIDLTRLQNQFFYIYKQSHFFLIDCHNHLPFPEVNTVADIWNRAYLVVCVLSAFIEVGGNHFSHTVRSFLCNFIVYNVFLFFVFFLFRKKQTFFLNKESFLFDYNC